MYNKTNINENQALLT